MFTKIDAHCAYKYPTFRSAGFVNQPILAKKALISGKSLEQMKILKNACAEIFANINADKSLLPKLESFTKSIKLTSTSINFCLSKDDCISFSIPRVGNDSLFQVELKKDAKPASKILLDSFGKVLKSYDEKILDYMSVEEVNAKLLESSIENIFETSDALLFELRMFIRKNCSEIFSPNLTKVAVPEISDYIIQKEESKKDEIISVDKKDLILKKPLIELSGAKFSYKELIKQEQEKREVLEKSEEISDIRKDFQLSVSKNEAKASSQKVKKVKRKPIKPKVQKIEIVKSKTTEKSKSIEKKLSVIKINDSKTKEISQKRKSGRPRKEISKTSKEKLPKQKGRPKSPKANLPLAGKIWSEGLEKVGKIIELNQYIETFIKSVSSQTRQIIYSSYAGLKARKGRFIFEDVDLRLFKRNTWNGATGISISGTDKNKINIFDTGLAPVADVDLKKATKLETLEFLTQSEVENNQQKNIFNNLLDKTIAEMEKYKIFLERRGWRSVERRLATANEGQISPMQFEMLKTVEEKYNAIRYKLMHMNSGKSCCIKRDYGITPIKTARLEFINAFNDGYNLIFSKAKTKYGNLHVLVKYNGGEVLDKAFLISEDGRLVKNINKEFGLKHLINHKEKNIKFYNDEQVKKENLLQDLDLLLEKLNQKMDDCNEYISTYQYVKK